ncbi:hypothetical protein [Aeromicrobium sp. CF3.5]|uniref:hypothetical protein n=1 Tax=Aeromicrobium sp. CF3.5 TaxID=3373078 RepID=UPI003EE4E13A
MTILFVVCQGAVDEATLDRIDTEDNDESTRAPQIGQWNRAEDPLGLGVHVLDPREPGAGWTAGRLADDFTMKGSFVYNVRATGQFEDEGLRSASSVYATRAEIDALEPGEVLVNKAEVWTRAEFDTACVEPTDAESAGDV